MSDPGERSATRRARAAMLGLLALVALSLAFALSACGSGSSSDSTGDEASGGTAQAGAGTAEGKAASGAGAGRRKDGGSNADGSTKSSGGEGSGGNRSQADPGEVPGDTSAGFQPRSHDDSGGGAGQFEAKGGDNSIQEFGDETASDELAQAAAALHNYLDARAAHAWAASCEYLAGGVAEQLAQLARSSGGDQAKQPSCAEVVAGLSAGVPDGALREAAVADVGALRVEGDRGFLLFKGAHGADYFVPVVREGGEWKVAAIAPSALG